MDGLKVWLDDQQAGGNLRRLLPICRKPGGLIRAADAEKNTPWSLDFSSNDYLALAEHADLLAASRDFLTKYGTGAGAARLMSGDLHIFHQLEDSIAALKGKEAALVFGSGYMANTGVIPALIGRGDVIFTDRLNHASIYDGCLLAGGQLVRFNHNDVTHLEDKLKKHRGRNRALIIVESIYSMDGDRCPLSDIVALKKKYACLLMVDEAHATGIYGAKGGGVIQEDGVGDDVDLAMGTFGKALGSYGAYIAADRVMIDYLVNRARTFVYTTALPPAVIGASLAGLEIIQNKPKLRQELKAKVKLFKDTLQDCGLPGTPGPSQIVPILIGDSEKAVAIAQELRDNLIHATAVRPPTVPPGTARLRFSITRHHSSSALVESARKTMEIIKAMAVEARF